MWSRRGGPRIAGPGKRLLVAAVILLVFGGSCTQFGNSVPEIRARDNDDVFAEMMVSSATIQEAMSPLYLCVPEEMSCYRDAGPAALSAVEAEQARFGELAGDVEDECFKEVVDVYQDSLNAYKQAAEAAVDENPQAVDEAIALSSEQEAVYTRKIGECLPSQGRQTELSNALLDSSIEIEQLATQMYECKNVRCVLRTSRAMEETAGEAVGTMDEFIQDLEQNDGPACMIDAIEKMRTAFISIEKAAVAVQQGRGRIAMTEGNKGTELALAAQQDFATCVSSLNSR